MGPPAHQNVNEGVLGRADTHTMYIEGPRGPPALALSERLLSALASAHSHSP